MTPDQILDAIADAPGTLPYDLAECLGVGEAALVSAQGAIPIAAHPDVLMPALCGLGEVMALTRNPSVVHEKTGEYAHYHPGEHAAMIVNHDIDLRMFPKHWVHAFAVTLGDRRSVQVFDAAGDAVHKVYARAATDMAAWDQMIESLRLKDTPETLDLSPRQPPEAAKADPDKVETLRSEWRKLTDTHQFLRLTARLKMNRLGAYRIAGAPFVRPLAPRAVIQCFEAAADRGCGLMVFVGNRGCIQIHSGLVHKLKRVGEWFNVLDPGFSLHLRDGDIAEVWAVDKPTKRGVARSLEFFAADGALIAQVFGERGPGGSPDHTAAFSDILDTLDQAPEAP